MGKTISTILYVGIFAIAMAYLESAVVIYLRDIYGINNLLTDLPTTPDKYVWIEVGRELCTLVMLLCMGLIAGKQTQDKLGYTFIAFGIWDIFYYIWLHIFIGWPAGLIEWDLLFMIPLPWWGPVLSPILISLLMIIGGIIIAVKSSRNIKIHISIVDSLILISGIILVLFVFMKDAVYNFLKGKSITETIPSSFDWILFSFSIVAMLFFLYRIQQQKQTSE